LSSGLWARGFAIGFAVAAHGESNGEEEPAKQHHSEKNGQQGGRSQRELFFKTLAPLRLLFVKTAHSSPSVVRPAPHKRLSVPQGLKPRLPPCHLCTG